MSTIAEALDTVALRCAIVAPGSWAASNTRTATEIRSILYATVDELLEKIDWPEPIRVDYDVDGDGSSTYALPSDFKRLVMDKGAVIDIDSMKRCIAVGKRSIWTKLTTDNLPGDTRYFRITGTEEDGYSLDLFPALETGDTVTLAYVSKNWLTNSSGASTEWNSETDTLLLPQRAVELGCIWRWRRQKGLPWEDNISEYEAYISSKGTENLAARAPL